MRHARAAVLALQKELSGCTGEGAKHTEPHAAQSTRTNRGVVATKLQDRAAEPLVDDLAHVNTNLTATMTDKGTHDTASVHHIANCKAQRQETWQARTRVHTAEGTHTEHTHLAAASEGNQCKAGVVDEALPDGAARANNHGANGTWTNPNHITTATTTHNPTDQPAEGSSGNVSTYAWVTGVRMEREGAQTHTIRVSAQTHTHAPGKPLRSSTSATMRWVAMVVRDVVEAPFQMFTLPHTREMAKFHPYTAQGKLKAWWVQRKRNHSVFITSHAAPEPRGARQ